MNAEHTPRGGIRFSEEMHGFLAADATTFSGGYRGGQSLGEGFMFHLNIRADDLDRLLSEPSHEAQLTGYVRGKLVGGECRISQGSLNLFVTNPSTRLKEMHYRLYFKNVRGEPCTLLGHKVIRGWPLSQILYDSTTLYTTVYHGHVASSAETAEAVYAIGIMRIGLWGTLRLLFSMRARAPSLLERINVLWRFGRFFLSSLWHS